MTNDQADIEKTLKRILARRFAEWPVEGAVAIFDLEGVPSFITGSMARVFLHCNGARQCVTQADWEAERALLAAEQAQLVGEAGEFSQELWVRITVTANHTFLVRCGTENYAKHEGKSKGACDAWLNAPSASQHERPAMDRPNAFTVPRGSMIALQLRKAARFIQDAIQGAADRYSAKT